MDTETWNLAAPPGFRGFDPGQPVERYERHLPHWRQRGATYFVTFRLADSLPQNKLRELRALRHEWELRHPPPRTNEQLEDFARRSMQRTEEWLDQGMGACVLVHGNAADKMESSLQYFAGERYELGAYVVMPNHVHLVVRPLNADSWSLETILKSWKSYTSRRIHTIVANDGPLWQEESHDRIVRDEPHLWQCLQYIGRNPRLAKDRPGNWCRIWVGFCCIGILFCFGKEFTDGDVAIHSI